MKWKFSGAAAAAGMMVAGLVMAPAQADPTQADPTQTDAAASAGEEYVALGDSYSSGTGTRSYIDDGSTCQRSTLAYPSLIAADRGYTLNFRACSGARVPDVANLQLDALDVETDLVTVSVGGNDAGFVDVLTECAQPGWMSNCDAAIDGAESFVNNTLPGRLSGLYASVRSAAPNAEVVVVGYPRLFMGEDCNALTWFSPAEQTRLNAMADLLNATTSSAAGGQGFDFADPTSRFTGHAVCDDPEYVNGLSEPISESYHPNALGHSGGYAPTVSPVLTGATLRVDGALVDRAEGSAEELAAQQREYADRDAAIEPEPFRVPVLP